MKIAITGVGARLAICTLLALTVETSTAQSTSRAKGRGSGKNSSSARNDRPVQVAKRERGGGVPGLEVTPHHHHVAILVRAGKESFHMWASPAGKFPVIVHEESELVLVNMAFGGAQPGRPADVLLYSDGWIAPTGNRVGIVPRSREKRGRWVAPSRPVHRSNSRPDLKKLEKWKGKQLKLRVSKDGMISFYYHYGENLHNQKINVVQEGRTFRLEFHLHPPGDAAHAH